MKKILLASTALVATAGIAAADVTVGGDGYFGAALATFDGDGMFPTKGTNSDGSSKTSDYAFIYDLDFDFTATGTSDSGLTFGASADVDDIGEGQSQGALGYEGEMFVSGDFGTLSMGDLDGAAEQVVGDLAGVGLSGLGDFNEFLYLVEGAAQPDGSPLALYEYSVEGLTLALGVTDDQGWSIGAGYDGGMWAVGLGYESVQEGATITVREPGTFVPAGSTTGPITITAPDDAHQTIGQAAVTFSGVTLKGVYGLIDLDGSDFAQYGLSAAYTFDATTITAYWRQTEVDAAKSSSFSDSTNNFYGLGAAYDLGGGLALEAGVAQYDFEDLDSAYVVADFGLSFNF